MSGKFTVAVDRFFDRLFQSRSRSQVFRSQFQSIAFRSLFSVAIAIAIAFFSVGSHRDRDRLFSVALAISTFSVVVATRSRSLFSVAVAPRSRSHPCLDRRLKSDQFIFNPVQIGQHLLTSSTLMIYAPSGFF